MSLLSMNPESCTTPLKVSTFTAAAARAPTSVAIAVFTFAVSAASSVNCPALRWFFGSEAQPAAPSAAARAMLIAVIAVLISCSFSPGLCAARRLFASARGSPPPACAPAHGHRAAADRTASGPASACLGLLVLPFAHLFFGIILGATIALLDRADELVAVARELVELVIGELAPALLHCPFHLLPVPGDAIPIHGGSYELRRLVCKSRAAVASRLHPRRLHQARHRCKECHRFHRFCQLGVVARRHGAPRVLRLAFAPQCRGTQAAAALRRQRAHRPDQHIGVVAAHAHVGEHDVRAPLVQRV